MPYMDGIAVCRKVRDSGRRVQIALISGDHPREHVDDMRELEIDYYVSKPVSPREILQLCEEQIGLLQVNP
jgi:DNA-binding response OmpR family regulator